MSNDANKSQNNHGSMYRTLVFKDPANEWCFPLPQLLGMHLTPKEPAEHTDSRIDFFFSCGNISVVGKSLSKLWEALVSGEISQIAVKSLTPPGAGYEVLGFTVDDSTPSPAPPQTETKSPPVR